jgi:protein-tyrosine phosphatase
MTGKQMHNQHLLKFKGTCNFRDIGGYEAQDGRTMKWGALFRSDELSRLSSEDLIKLQQLNLRTICDLRAPKERKSKPDRVPDKTNICIVNVPIYHRGQNANRLQKWLWLLTGKLRDFDSELFMKDFYHSIAFDHATEIGEIMTLISDKRNLPALIHCKGGKDRTGFVSAIIQLLLGVPRKTVLEDYLLSNRFFEPQIARLIRYIRRMSLFRISPDRIRPVLEARGEYIQEAIDDILKTYGTIEGYLLKACGITRKSIISLHDLLLD